MILLCDLGQVTFLSAPVSLSGRQKIHVNGFSGPWLCFWGYPVTIPQLCTGGGQSFKSLDCAVLIPALSPTISVSLDMIVGLAPPFLQVQKEHNHGVSVTMTEIMYVEHQAQCPAHTRCTCHGPCFSQHLLPGSIPGVLLGPRIILIGGRNGMQRGQVSHRGSQSTAQVQPRVPFLSLTGA